MLFECHITLHLCNKDVGLIAAKEFKWKHSQIERDPVLGNDEYFYLTTYDDDYINMFHRMNTVSDFCARHDAAPVRMKIEMIMYDTKGK